MNNIKDVLTRKDFYKKFNRYPDTFDDTKYIRAPNFLDEIEGFYMDDDVR